MYSTANPIQISYEESKKNTLDYTALEDKNLFRLSLNSQSSNTTSTESSSNRLSYISYTDDDYVTYCKSKLSIAIYMHSPMYTLRHIANQQLE